MLTPVPPLRRALLLLGPLLTACAGGTETGNPSASPFEATLSYAAFSSDPQHFAVRNTADVAEVRSVWLALGNASFLPEGGCASGDAPAYAAPALGVGDHASGSPVQLTFVLAAGGYCAVDLALVPSTDPLPADAPASLSGRSIDVEGTLADGTPFRVLSASSTVLRLPAAAGTFELDAKNMATLLGFDVATWLAAVDFAGATATDGIVEISAASNADRLPAFEAALAAGVVLFRDDGDGVLDATPEKLAAGTATSGN